MGFVVLQIFDRFNHAQEVISFDSASGTFVGIEKEVKEGPVKKAPTPIDRLGYKDGLCTPFGVRVVQAAKVQRGCLLWGRQAGDFLCLRGTQAHLLGFLQRLQARRQGRLDNRREGIFVPGITRREVPVVGGHVNMEIPTESVY